MSSTEPEEDFLSVDTPIPGQNFACLSFVSPEKELERKDLYYVHRFLEEHAEEFSLSKKEIVKKYDDYMYTQGEDLEKAFYEENDFRTTVRGVKVRGVYDTYREAQVRAKLLQRKDTSFHVFVGQVGYWLPWDPNADKIEDQEYTEGHLNKLVKKYKENQQKRDTYFEEEKRKPTRHATEPEATTEATTEVTTEVTKEKTTEATTEVTTEETTEETTEVPTEPPTAPPLKNLEDKDPWLKRKEQNGGSLSPSTRESAIAPTDPPTDPPNVNAEGEPIIDMDV